LTKYFENGEKSVKELNFIKKIMKKKTTDRPYLIFSDHYPKQTFFLGLKDNIRDPRIPIFTTQLTLW